jgi:hypothetical protein
MKIAFHLTEGVLTYAGDKPKNTMQAVDISITKWLFIKQLLHDDASFDENGIHTCGLCMLHYAPWRDDDCCVTCPIANKTGEALCAGTPYEAFCDDPNPQTAQAEIDFLIELKRELEGGSHAISS